MKLLVSGGLGFIGSNFVRYLLSETTAHIHVLDCSTYAARPDWINEHPEASRVTVHHADIRDQTRVMEVLSYVRPEMIFHLAAESHVCRSIEGPLDFMETNIMGTFNMVEALRKLEMKFIRFVHVSTDEVFGELYLGDDAFTESTQIQPRSPYAASKASSDHIVMAYHHTYGLDAVITNCSNNFGPNQHEEKLIPKTILSFIEGKPMTLYGGGNQIRDWIHVDDHCEGIFLAGLHGVAGQRYLFGGEMELENVEVVEAIAEIMVKHIPELRPSWKRNCAGRATDDFRYAINNTKSKDLLGYAPRADLFDQRLEETIKWYLHRNR